MDTEKTRELREYLHLLLHLESNAGIDCKIKIEQALDALHLEMGFVSVEKETLKWEGIANSVMTKVEKDLTAIYSSNEDIKNKVSVNPFNIFG